MLYHLDIYIIKGVCVCACMFVRVTVAAITHQKINIEASQSGRNFRKVMECAAHKYN
jgi:hypothetical protein